MSHRAGAPRSGDASKANVRNAPTACRVSQLDARRGADMSYREERAEAKEAA